MMHNNDYKLKINSVKRCQSNVKIMLLKIVNYVGEVTKQEKETEYSINGNELKTPGNLWVYGFFFLKTL